MKLSKVFLFVVIFVIANQKIWTQDCEPEGTPIGYYGGATAHSNGGNFNTAHQCVFFVQDFFKARFDYNLYFGVDFASQFFDEGPNHGFIACPNGGAIAPAPDMILCYNGGLEGAGHVAIITEVTTNSVTIIDENRSCTNAFATLTRNGNNLISNMSNYTIQGWLVFNPVGRLSNGNIDQRFVDFYNTSGCPFSAEVRSGSIWNLDEIFCVHAKKMVQFLIKDLIKEMSKK
jgi:hypothetical protein